MKAIEELRTVLRVKHYSVRTERSYIGHVLDFIQFHGGEGAGRKT